MASFSTCRAGGKRGSTYRSARPAQSLQQVRDMLGRFGLEGHHHEQEIATLSGGQKSRVVFVELGMQRSHLT